MQLQSVVRGMGFHGCYRRAQPAGGSRGFKLAQERGNCDLEFALGNSIQPPAKDAEQKQPLPQFVTSVPHQSQHAFPDGPEPGQQRALRTGRIVLTLRIVGRVRWPRLDRSRLRRCEQPWIEQDQPRRLGAGKRKRLLFDTVDRMNNARIRSARVREKLRTVLRLNAAKAVTLEHRTVIGVRHSDLGENLRSGDDLPGAVDTDCILRRNKTADLNQVSQGTRRKFSILLISLPVNRNAPTLAASVFASGANAAKSLGVVGANQSRLGQWALLRIGTSAFRLR